MAMRLAARGWPWHPVGTPPSPGRHPRLDVRGPRLVSGLAKAGPCSPGGGAFPGSPPQWPEPPPLSSPLRGQHRLFTGFPILRRPRRHPVPPEIGAKPRRAIPQLRLSLTRERRHTGKTRRGKDAGRPGTRRTRERGSRRRGPGWQRRRVFTTDAAGFIGQSVPGANDRPPFAETGRKPRGATGGRPLPAGLAAGPRADLVLGSAPDWS